MACLVTITLPLAGCFDAAPALRNESSPATRAAETACRAEIAARSGSAMDDTSVRWVRTTEQGISVTIGAPGRIGGWTCLADASGKVLGVAEG